MKKKRFDGMIFQVNGGVKREWYSRSKTTHSEVAKLRRIISLALTVLVLLSSCVSQPRFSDYVGLQESEAQAELNSKKTTNVVKIVINWLTVGYGTFWLASVIDTIKMISFSSDFEQVSRQIEATPDGALVGQLPPAAQAPQPQVQPSRGTDVADVNMRELDTAIMNISGILAEKIPSKSTLAILSVSSVNRNTSEYIISELEYRFVESGKFTIVDRRRLDQIRNEQNFQISGEVSDNSAVSIGNMLGAGIVLVGELSINDAQQRLMLKAIDVQSAQIIAMARENL